MGEAAEGLDAGGMHGLAGCPSPWLGCQGGRGSSGLSLLPHHGLLSVMQPERISVQTASSSERKLLVSCWTPRRGPEIQSVLQESSLDLYCFYKPHFAGGNLTVRDK